MATFEEIFEAQKASSVEELRKKQLENNTNRTYGDILSEKELGILAVLTVPELNAMAQRGMSPDVYQQYINELEPKSRIAQYNLPPVEYGDPEFEERLRLYEKRSEQRENVFEKIGDERQALLSGVAGMPTVETPPIKFGYDEEKRIAKLGIDPTNVLDIEGINNFKSAMALLAPRNTTPDDLNYAKENLFGGLYKDVFPGKFSYIDPSLKETRAMRYDEEGKAPRIYDRPSLTGIDVAELALQEGPVIAGELFIGLPAVKYFDDFLKKVPVEDIGPIRKIGDSIAGNILLSGGAAGVNLIQRLTGLASGAHDRSFSDMLEETGWLMLLTYSGNQTIDAFLNGIPKLYRAASGKDVSASEIAAIREAIETARKSAKGETSEGVTLLDIDQAIDQLSSEVARELPKYNPTLVRASKDERMADIEQLLLTSSSATEYQKFFNEALKGNEEVIKEFFDALYSKLDADVTGQTVGRELTNLFSRRQDQFLAEGEAIMDRFTTSLDAFKTAGDKKLLDEVLDEKASTRLYDRFTSRINEISRTYKEKIGQDVEKELTSPELSGLFSGRKIKPEIERFKKAGEGAGPLITVGRGEVRAAFKDLFPEDALQRLTKYSEGDLTLPEINQLRMDLNSYVSALNPQKIGQQKIFDLGRKLQRSIEEQMYQQITKQLPAEEAARVISVLNGQKYGMELANKEILRNLGREQPENLIGYLFSTNTKRAANNTRVGDFMTFLKETGSQAEINTLRNEVIEYVKNQYITRGDASPLELAANYKKFLRNYRGTLNEIFPESEFGKVFDTPKSFQKNIIEPLEAIQAKSATLERVFGSNNPYNIVTEILGTGEGTKASGKIIEDLDLLDNLINIGSPKEQKILRKQISDATKKYLSTITETVDGNFDVNKLAQIMETGFGDPGKVGAGLSFEGVFGRLLGDDAGTFIRNLEILRDMQLRETIDLTSPTFRRAEVERRVTDPRINYLKRFFIPPLTRFGRRVTAAEKLSGEKNMAFLGELFRDEKLFTAYADAITNRKKINNFIRLLNTYDKTLYTDIGNELKYYDVEDKEQKAGPEGFLEKAPSVFVPGLTGTRINKARSERMQ